MSFLPINLPPRIKPGNAITADWANSIRESLGRLARKTGVKRGIAVSDNSHPWKVTCSEDDATVAAGFLSRVVALGTPGVDASAWPFVEVPTEYDGTTTLTALPTGTNYIYAAIALTDIYHAGGSEIMKTNPPDGILETENHVYQTSGVITVYTSTDAPGTESSETGSWIIPIAQVEVTDGIAAVTKQYLRENRTMHMTLFTMQPV